MHRSDVDKTMALTLLESSIIARTFDHVGPVSVTIPTRPVPAITFIFFSIPSLLPLSIVKSLNQFVPLLEMTCAPTFL